MAKEPNWAKHSVIATWTVGLVASALGILQYLRPPDPTHPMSFDFLSRSIVVPPWLAAIILFGVVAITTLVIRLKYVLYYASKPMTASQKVPDQQNGEVERLRSQLAMAQAQIKNLVKGKAEQIVPKASVTGSLTVDKAPLDWDTECRLLTISWPEGLAVEIDSDHIGSVGLTLSVINNTPEYIASYKVEVAEANSWNETHQKFLPNHSFNRRLINSGKNLEPIHKTNGQWLLRELRKGDSVQLSIGDDGNSPLSWPNNDPTTIEIWRLTLGVSYDRLLNLGNGSPIGLLPAYVLVRWDRENRTIAMLKQA